MFCKSCGHKIDDDSMFCSFCGTKQSLENKPLTNVDESLTKDEAKTLNVNLSFARQSDNRANSPTKTTYAQPKYDPDYEKETDATSVGAILLISTLLLVIFQPFSFDNIESYNQFRVISSIGALLLRIIITSWVVNIAKRQNRETFSWGLFAFFLPSIALIIIGQLRKIFDSIEFNSALSNKENSAVITEKANNYLKGKDYNKAIKFSEKAIELDPENKVAADILKKAKLEIPVNQIPNKQTQIVYRETKDGKILKIISTNYQTVGASVFIDDSMAPDGKYDYINDDRKLIVKDGKIERMMN